MMAQSTINIRLDEDLKNEFNSLMDELGLSMSAAFTVFAKTAVREQRIPFPIGLERPSRRTFEAAHEAKELLEDPSSTYYDSAADLFRAKGWS